MRRRKLPDMEKAETAVYEKVKGIIHAQVFKICSLNHLPFDEMTLQANLLFVHALRRVDDTQGVKFSTFLTSVVHNGLIDYGRKFKIQGGESFGVRVPGNTNQVEYTQDDDPLIPYAAVVDNCGENPFRLADDLSSLSEHARMVVEYVLSSGTDSIMEVRSWFTATTGLSEYQFQSVRNELRKMVNSW